MADIFLRFVITISLLLAVGVTTAYDAGRRYGSQSATVIERGTIVLVLVAFFAVLLPVPRIPLSVAVPALSYNTGVTAIKGRQSAVPHTTTLVAPTEIRRSKTQPSLTFVVAMILGAGAVCMLLRLMSGQFMLIRLRRNSSPLDKRAQEQQEIDALALVFGVRSPLLYRSPQVPGPLLIGIRCPVLILPASAVFSEAERRAVFAHELAHIRRRDLLWNLFALLAGALCWWHPLIWVLIRNMKQTAEEACDKTAVRTGTPAPTYARLLLRLSERWERTALPGLSMSSFRTAAGKRIARLLQGQPERFLPRWGMAGLGLFGIVLLCVSILVSGYRSQEAAVDPAAAATPFDSASFQRLLENAIHVRNPAETKTTIVAFIDFQCPACRRGYGISSRQFAFVFRPSAVRPNTPVHDARITVEFPSARLIFRHLPLHAMHEHAMPAAIVAEAAGKQGKFWEMCDALFAEPKATLDEQYFVNCARNIRLDLKRFQQDRADPALKARIEEDVRLANACHIGSVPTFIIRQQDGKCYQAVGVKQLEEVLRQENGAK